MKKTVWGSAVCFMAGTMIGTLIPILISLQAGKGQYDPAAPYLLSIVPDEVHAVLLQLVLTGFMGIGYGAGMMVFENEKMSLLQQTALYFVIACAVQFIPAWICGWMEHSLPAVLTYVMVSVMFSALIWIMIYAGIRHTVRNMNQKLKKQ